MNKHELINAILEYFKVHDEIYNDVIERVDEWTGILGNDRYYDMEDLNEYNFTDTHTKILTAAFLGYDEDTTNGDEHAPFCPLRAYYRSDGARLFSSDHKDYTNHLDIFFVDGLIDKRENLGTLPCVVSDLLDELTEIKEWENLDDDCIPFC